MSGPWEKYGGGSGAPWEKYGSAEVDVNPIAGTARAGLQGMTFGLSDEVGGAMAALAGSLRTGEPFSDAYDKIHQQLQDKREQFSKDHPGVALSAEIGGGVLTGGVGGAKALGGAAYRNASNAGKLGRISGVGATESGIYGAGTADQGERTSGAIGGAATGAIAAPIGAGLINAAGRGLGAASNYAASKLTRTPKDNAVQVMRDTADAIGMTADDAVSEMRRMGPQAALVDLDDAFRVIGRAGMNRQGTMRTTGRQFVDERQAGQQKRLMGAIKAVGGDKNFQATYAEYVAKRAKAAAPLYDEAYEVGLRSTDDLTRLLSHPNIKTHARKAQKIAEAEGRNDLLSVVQMTKERLDDSISAAVRAGKKNEARRLMGLKKELMGEVGKQNPAFIRANDMYSNESRFVDALEIGRDFLKKDPDELAMIMRDMSKSEKDLVSIGAVRALGKRLDGIGQNRDAVRNLLQTKAMRDRLGLVMDDPSALLKQAGIEEQFTQSRNMLTGNSTTALQQEAGRALDQGIDEGLASAIESANPGAIVANIVKTFTRGKASPEIINELGSMMFRKGMSEREIRRIFTSPRIRQAFGDQYDEIVGPYVRAGVAPAFEAAQ